MEAGGSEVVNYSRLLGKFKASLALMGPCLKISKEEVERLDPADVWSGGPLLWDEAGENREFQERNGEGEMEWTVGTLGLQSENGQSQSYSPVSQKVGRKDRNQGVAVTGACLVCTSPGFHPQHFVEKGKERRERSNLGVTHRSARQTT